MKTRIKIAIGIIVTLILIALVLKKCEPKEEVQVSIPKTTNTKVIDNPIALIRVDTTRKYWKIHCKP